MSKEAMLLVEQLPHQKSEAFLPFHVLLMVKRQ